MIRKLNLLWLEGIFDENTVKLFPSLSVASNFWQVSLIESLINHESTVDVVGFCTERAWPFGRLLISRKNLVSPKSIGGAGLGYINLPFFRVAHQTILLLIWIIKYLIIKPIKPDYLVVYSCLVKSWTPTAPILAARTIRRFTGIPILCVVADGSPPKGADRYVYLAWSSYQLAEAQPPKLHLDGGVPVIEDYESRVHDNQNIDKTIFMYMGGLAEHGGINELASVFATLQSRNIELWICGRGDNDQLQKLANSEDQIKLMGFLGDDELYEMAFRATFFVNPRPLGFDPNKLNFPSKLLLYLAFGKPVISTISLGMSPEYSSIVIEIEDESEEALIRSLESAIQMNTDAYNAFCEKVVNFKELHTWDMQVSNLIKWINTSRV